MRFLAWLLVIIAVILMILGLIAFLIQQALLGVNHAINYFNVASSLLLLAIFCSLLNPCKNKE